MENSGAAPSGLRAASLTRTLCVLVMALMLVAVIYGAFMALRFYPQIGV